MYIYQNNIWKVSFSVTGASLMLSIDKHVLVLTIAVILLV